jgi:hypothetical protein
MPLWTVELNVNVPGTGAQQVVQTGINATDLAAALAHAVSNVTITPIRVTQEGDGE